MVEKYNLNKIKPELVKIKDCDLEQDFVAITVETDNVGSCYHSGLLICYDEELYYFHYNAEKVILEKVDPEADLPNLFFKELNIVHETEVEAFLGHCEKLIKMGISPLYGFVFNNSYYDSTTKENFLANAQHDFTTCVGFCIKVIRGFIYNHPEYLKLSDWDYSTLNTANRYLLDYFNHNLNNYSAKFNIETDNIANKSEIRRITPAELLCSGFFTNLPILKASIDSIRQKLETEILGLSVA